MRVALALAASTLAGIFVTAAVASDDATPPPPPPPAPNMEALKGVNFVSACGFSHRATNAWDAAELDRLVSGCLNALRHCQRGD